MTTFKMVMFLQILMVVILLLGVILWNGPLVLVAAGLGVLALVLLMVEMVYDA